MAYRYEGMRLHDFVRCLRTLQDDLQDGSGPYNKRAAWHTWARWVQLAGGRVRGVTPKEQLDYIKPYDPEVSKANLKARHDPRAFLPASRCRAPRYRSLKVGPV